MIGYAVTYGDSLEEVTSFTSGMFITKILEQQSNEKNQIYYNKENFDSRYRMIEDFGFRKLKLMFYSIYYFYNRFSRRIKKK